VRACSGGYKPQQKERGTRNAGLVDSGALGGEKITGRQGKYIYKF
jgi:hypothetical protein